jgi:hypothetical protein
MSSTALASEWPALLERDLFVDAALRQAPATAPRSAWTAEVLSSVSPKDQESFRVCGSHLLEGLAQTDWTGESPKGQSRWENFVHTAVASLQEASAWLLEEGSPNLVHELLWSRNNQAEEGFWRDQAAELGYRLLQLLAEFEQIELPEDLADWQARRYAQLCNLEARTPLEAHTEPHPQAQGDLA